MGDSIPGVGGTYVYTFGPGRYQLTCEAARSTFEVVDPEELYIPAELLCPAQLSSTVDYAQGARGPHAPVLDVARSQIHGLQPGDVVEHAGYPQAAGGQAVRVVRQGQVVAVVAYEDDGHGGWLMGGTRTCSGSNVTTVSTGG